MELRFDLPDVANWARFSGDYNPIHFEIERARQLGTDRLIVHGMLAMLPVKRELAATPSSAHGHEWHRFRALLRSPIPHGAPLKFSSRCGPRGLQFRVDGADVPEEFVRGSFGAGEDPTSDLQQPIMADTVLDPSRFADFHCHYGDSPGWVALDAVLFADFMQTKVEPLRQWTRERAGERLASGIEQALIVHTSHTVTFAADGSAWRAGSELAYHVRSPDVIVGEGQLICTVPLTVKAGPIAVMTVELGLLLKLPSD